MKICILTSSYPLSRKHHAGHFVREPALQLARLGHEVRVVAPDAPDATLKEDVLDLHRFQYFPLRRLQCLAYGSGILPNIKASPLARIQIPLFMASYRRTATKLSGGCDIIHAQWSVSAIAGIQAKRRNKVPLVMSILGSDFTGAGGRWIDKMTSYALTHVDGVITVSKPLLNRVLATGFPEDRCMLVNNGVDLDTFRPSNVHNGLKGTPLEQCGKVIAFVGRLSDVKAPDLALAAFETALGAINDLGMVFVGDGDMRDMLESRVIQSDTLKGRVHFAGQVGVDEVARILGASDALLLTSRAEGTPNTVFEAFASGIPVVSVPVGGIPDVLDSGDKGVLTSGHDTKEIANALVELFRDDTRRTRLGTHARAWAEAELSWEQTARSWMALYQRILHESGHAG